MRKLAKRSFLITMTVLAAFLIEGQVGPALADDDVFDVEGLCRLRNGARCTSKAAPPPPIVARSNPSAQTARRRA